MFISFNNPGGQGQRLGSYNVRDRVRWLWRAISYCKSEPLYLDQELLRAEWSHASLLLHLQETLLQVELLSQSKCK